MGPEPDWSWLIFLFKSHNSFLGTGFLNSWFFPLNILSISCAQKYAYFSLTGAPTWKDYILLKHKVWPWLIYSYPKKFYFANSCPFCLVMEQKRPLCFSVNNGQRLNFSHIKSGSVFKAGRETKSLALTSAVEHISCKCLNPGLLLVCHKKRNMHIVFLLKRILLKARTRITYLNSCLNTYN